MAIVQAEQKCALLNKTLCSFLVLLIHLGLVCFNQILPCSNQLSRRVETLFLTARCHSYSLPYQMGNQRKNKRDSACTHRLVS